MILFSPGFFPFVRMATFQMKIIFLLVCIQIVKPFPTYSPKEEAHWCKMFNDAEYCTKPNMEGFSFYKECCDCKCKDQKTECVAFQCVELTGEERLQSCYTRYTVNNLNADKFAKMKKGKN